MPVFTAFMSSVDTRYASGRERLSNCGAGLVLRHGQIIRRPLDRNRRSRKNDGTDNSRAGSGRDVSVR
jgi:hypothetical protein